MIKSIARKGISHFPPTVTGRPWMTSNPLKALSVNKAIRKITKEGMKKRVYMYFFLNEGLFRFSATTRAEESIKAPTHVVRAKRMAVWILLKWKLRLYTTEKRAKRNEKKAISKICILRISSLFFLFIMISIPIPRLIKPIRDMATILKMK